MPGIGSIIGGIVPALLGGVAGATNTRPPSLDPTQRKSLDTLIPYLQNIATGPAGIDPIQKALMYGNIAGNQTGAMDAVTHALVSRGLGHSGLLGGALTQVVNQAQQNRNQADLSLQQQGVQIKQQDIQNLLSALNVQNIPGQSGIGGFFSGMAPIAAYSIQSALNRSAYGGGAPHPQVGDFGGGA